MNPSITAVVLAAGKGTRIQPFSEKFPKPILPIMGKPLIQHQVECLRDLGVQVHLAEDGEQALQAMRNEALDLVLMDCQMPHMDGIEATKRIIAELGDARPRIIAMTANAVRGDREACLAAGMDDYISKPVKMHEIADAIRRHFAKPTVQKPSRQLTT